MSRPDSLDDAANAARELRVWPMRRIDDFSQPQAEQVKKRPPPQQPGRARDFLISLRAAYQEFRRVLKRRAWMRKNRASINSPF